jgi:hypothetical protein
MKPLSIEGGSMRIANFLKSVLLVAVCAISFNASAAGLVSKAQTATATEISGLGIADSKFVIAAPTAENASIDKLSVNTVGTQGKGQVVERSDGCSYGCSTGCSNGCSSGCSSGCSVGCSVGCR